MTDAERRRRVILVREFDQHGPSGGCCGAVGDPFADHRQADRRGGSCDAARAMAGIAAAHQALRAELGELVDVQVTDAGNTAWLAGALWRDARRAGASLGQAWRVVRRGSANGAIVCDGEVLSTGAVPDPEHVVRTVVAHLARPAG